MVGTGERGVPSTVSVARVVQGHVAVWWWDRSPTQGAAASAPDYVPLAEALTSLGVAEGELRALLVQGRLRGFRDAASLKFLKTEIEALRHQRGPRRA